MNTGDDDKLPIIVSPRYHVHDDSAADEPYVSAP